MFEAHGSSAGVFGGTAQPYAALGCLTGRGDSSGSHCASASKDRTTVPPFGNTKAVDERRAETRAPETAPHAEKNV